ncbi:SBBP repeat-containing protein [Flavobacterium sp.]|uniref:SBBP repeat-containing protein n=1 Tax=Flavobacterium sp. TaxID=239 RepID=UPI0032672DC7
MKQKSPSKLTYCFINNNNHCTKTILLLLWYILFNAAQSQAQNPKLAWAKKMCGTGVDYSRSIVVDTAGNVYTTGKFCFSFEKTL